MKNQIKIINILIGMIIYLGLAACSLEKQEEFSFPVDEFSLSQAGHCSEISEVLKSNMRLDVEGKLNVILNHFEENSKTYCDEGVNFDYKNLIWPKLVTNEIPNFAKVGSDQDSINDNFDLIKSDGRFVYFIANKKVKIAQLHPLQHLKLLSELDLEGSPIGIYLKENQVIVLSEISVFETKLYVFSVKVPESPKLTRVSTYRGKLLSQRFHGNNISMAFSNLSKGGPSYEIPDFSFLNDCDPNKNDTQRIEDGRAQIEKVKLKVKSDLEKYEYNSTLLGGVHLFEEEEFQDEVSCEDHYLSEQAVLSRDSILLISSSFSHEQVSDQYRVILNSSNWVYFGAQSFFMASPDFSLGVTNFHRFNLEEKMSYKGSGQVKGKVSDQFAFNELDGELRVISHERVFHDSGDYEWITYLTKYSSKNKLFQNVGELHVPGLAETFGLSGFLYSITDKTSFTLDWDGPSAPQISNEVNIDIPVYPINSIENYIFTVAFEVGVGIVNRNVILTMYGLNEDKNFRAIGEKITLNEVSVSGNSQSLYLNKNQGILVLPIRYYDNSSSEAKVGANIYKFSKENGLDLIKEIDQIPRRSLLISEDNGDALLILTYNRLSLFRLDNDLEEMGNLEWEL